MTGQKKQRCYSVSKANLRIIICFERVKGIFRDPLIRSVLFSYTYRFILNIHKELSYTNLTSQGLLQKQSRFDKVGKSFTFFNLWFPCIMRICHWKAHRKIQPHWKITETTLKSFTKDNHTEIFFLLHCYCYSRIQCHILVVIENRKCDIFDFGLIPLDRIT